MGEAAGRLAGEAKEKLKRKSWLEKGGTSEKPRRRGVPLRLDEC